MDVPSTTGTAIPESIGRYRLLQKIAKGGMAEVFAARSYGAHGFEKTVALKRILPKFGRDPQFVRMMVDEAKISVLLNHPNIAQILELGEQDGDYFIVMEFVPGQSLSAVVKRLKEEGARLPILEACFIVVELLQGLHAAHVQRDASGKPAHIIHRDVSPQNTLVSFDGHVKVIDFGIARARDRLEATEIGTIKGKLRYLAPEMIDPGRFTEDGDFDHRVDVFAAGIVLWELIAGRTLFPGDDEMKVYDDITDGKTPDLHQEGLCDAALMKIVHKALERSLDQRYATAEEFADDLRAYVYRSDPSFTHKRVAAILDRLFPEEKAAMLALERGQSSPSSAEIPSLRVRNKEQHAEKSKPSPVAASAQSVGASGRNAPAPAPETRAMRSDKHPAGPLKKSLPVADMPTVLVDGDAAELVRELPRDKDLTVVTLVSRQQVLHTSTGSKVPSSSSDNVFSGADDATVTVSADTLREARELGAKKQAERAGHAHPRAATPATAPRPPGASSSRPRAAPARSDETPLTRPRVDAVPVEGGKKRVVALSAVIGVVVALAIVGVVEVLDAPPSAAAPGSTAAPSSPTSSPPPSSVAPERVPVTISCATPGATVFVGAEQGPAPFTVQAAPGAALDVRVSAPHAKEAVERVLVPADQRAPLTVDVELGWQPVGVELRVTPADAVVTIDDRPATAATTVQPGIPVLVVVSAPGHVPARQRMQAEPGRPLLVAVDLLPEAAQPRDRVEPRRAKEPKASKEQPPRGTGTLSIKTSPYWGQVTVDGKTWEDATPLVLQLPAGKHDVVVSHPPRGLVKRFTVTLKPGETVTKNVVFD